MDIAKHYGTDKAKEEEGIWIQMGDGAEVRVARLGNKSYSDAIKRLMVPHQLALRKKNLSDEVVLRITIESMAEAILLEWKGIKDSGKSLPYTRENAVRLLTDYPDFREEIAAIAGNMENFMKDQEEATAKN